MAICCASPLGFLVRDAGRNLQDSDATDLESLGKISGRKSVQLSGSAKLQPGCRLKTVDSRESGSNAREVPKAEPPYENLENSFCHRR